VAGFYVLLLHGLILWGLALASREPPAPPAVIVIQTHIERHEEKPPPPPPLPPVPQPVMPEAHMPILPQVASSPLPNAITPPTPAPHRAVTAPPGPVEQPAPPDRRPISCRGSTRASTPSSAIRAPHCRRASRAGPWCSS